jgi:hypothetical protein
MNFSQSHISEKIGAVRTKLSDYFSDIENQRLEDLRVTQVIQRPFSTIRYLEVQTSTSRKRLVMKSINHHPINMAIIERDNQALVEYNILCQLYPKFEAIEYCSVPRPILVIPEIETYLMEFVEGDLLIDRLRLVRHFSSRRRFAELQRHFFDVGRWLRYFQKFTGVSEEGSESLQPVIERFESRLDLIERSEHFGDEKKKRLMETARDLLDQTAKDLLGLRIPVSGCHTDFHPLNVLVSDKGVTVIDFMGYRRGCVALDVLKTLVLLEDEMSSLFASAYRVGILKERFLEGYGVMLSIPLPALILCEAMERILSIAGSITTTKRFSRIHHRLEERLRIKKLIKWLEGSRENTLLWPTR